jgi:hypothetical protein
LYIMTKNTTQSSAYTKGLTDETIIINKLTNIFPGLVFCSTTEDNIKNDIDAWLKGIPVSIKCYSENQPTNFAFELENLHANTKTWNKSWYYNGKAKAHIIWHQKLDTVYSISKAKIIEYVKVTGFDRIVELKNDTKNSQQNIGHLHINSRLGILKISKMVELGIAKVLFNTADYTTELANHAASTFTKPPVYTTPTVTVVPSFSTPTATLPVSTPTPVVAPVAASVATRKPKTKPVPTPIGEETREEKYMRQLTDGFFSQADINSALKRIGKL